MAEFYPKPLITIYKANPTSYTVTASFENDINVFYQPTSCEMSVTPGNIKFTQTKTVGMTQIEPYVFRNYFVSKGNDHVFVSVTAEFADGTTTFSMVEYDTVVQYPITSISATVDSVTMSDNDETSIFEYNNNNIVILPALASIKELTYKQEGDSPLVISEEGHIRAFDAKPGVYTIELKANDGVSTASTKVKVIVTKPPEAVIKINADELLSQHIKYLYRSGLSSFDFAFDTVKVTPDDATNKVLKYSQSPITAGISVGADTGIVNISGSGLAGTKRIVATSQADNTLSTSMGFNIVGVLPWNNGYNSCPDKMATLDYNCIKINVQYLADKTLGSFNMAYILPTETIGSEKAEFEALFTQVKNIITNGVWNGTSISTLNLDSSKIPTTFVYAPSQPQWNIILDYMRQIKEYIDANP